MKKHIFILVILLFISTISYCQQSFKSILDTLSVEKKIVNTLISDSVCSDYFKMMSENKNFRFKDKDVILISSYQDFNIYLMVPEGKFTEPVQQTEIYYSDGKVALLFDKNQQKCFSLKYLKTVLFFYSNLGNNTSKIEADFYENIDIVTALDNQFNPIWGIHNFVQENWIENNEAGRIATFEIFFPCKDTFYYKSKSLFKREMNINNIGYSLLSNRFDITQEEIDSIDSRIGKVNLEWLYSGFYPGY